MYNPTTSYERPRQLCFGQYSFAKLSSERLPLTSRMYLARDSYADRRPLECEMNRDKPKFEMAI